MKTTPLRTARLDLIPADPAHIVTLLESPNEFAAAAGVPAAEGLRDFYGGEYVAASWLAALRAATGPDPWRHGFFLVHREQQVIIGTAGLKGRPDADGMVEIAYGVVSAFEGNGFATEAADALVRFVRGVVEVRQVIAHTLPEANASTQVLRKCGFEFVGEVVDPEDGPVWRWRHVSQ